jgi:hypothetical protein
MMNRAKNSYRKVSRKIATEVAVKNVRSMKENSPILVLKTIRSSHGARSMIWIWTPGANSPPPITYNGTFLKNQ